MIELPEGVVPNAMAPALMDFGAMQEPSSGASAIRIDRPGNRYRCQFGLPPHQMARHGRVIVSRLIRAKSEGLRVPFQLAGVHQGNPGLPVVDGGGQAGMFLAVRNLTPHYAAKEGFWLSIVDESEGEAQHYLHNVAGGVAADANGEAVLPLCEMLRAPFADGARVHLAKPMIEGMVSGDERSWEVSLAHHLLTEFEIREVA
ncbi:hypothetical protein [Alteriqipengyuania lutimaris]|uniref:Uncharacterized protein n=1 Tax=Alteriqipengyuania lutimaris TaxID=1538146 RepID=A0A395LQQ1_9SPHN|nr:hypothetical protein [Alteriqipengyuania lutimaris]MBB3034060.1 hypothetical protein [Alteriqipengyuania lutimaris]RDS77000.1 hypothetical protein DL238_04840 [Alteriqipengyuania lutimaris]